MAPKNIALVLGGGGSAGHAWMIGVIAGLAEGGFDLTQLADLVIGTSAGANVGLQVRSGMAPAELLAAVLTPPPPRPQAGGAPRPTQPPPNMEPVFQRMRAISGAATSARELQRAMAAYGLESDPKFGPEVAEKRRAMVAGRLPRKDWPERRMMIVAVNAETGELTPDADSRDAMGTNQIDFATRIPSASAGYAQGKLEAPRLTSLAE